MKRVFIILLVFCFSCAEQKDIQVDIYGISFTCPSGWKVTEKEDYEDTWYISIEKKGFSSSGLVNISFTKEDYELDEYLQIFQESFLNQKVIRNLVFQEAKEEYYGQYKGIVSTYNFVTLSVKHDGKMYVFHENGITMCIIHQGAVEDREKNLRGFEIIEKSLSLKKGIN